MRKLTLLLSIVALAATTTFAQNSYLSKLELDFTVGTANQNFETALMIQRIHRINLIKKLQLGLGYGLRYTANSLKDRSLTASPEKFQSDDRLALSSGTIHSLNAAIHLQISWGRFEAGFNIDVGGLGFGGSQTGTYSVAGVVTSQETAKPTPTNLLLGGSRDIGSLHSERYVRYWINDKLAVKLALGHLFGEYTTDRKLNLDNDRFRTIYDPLIVGVTYRFLK